MQLVPLYKAESESVQISPNCRVSLMAAVAFCLHHSAWQLEAEDAGSHGLDEGLLLWKGHLTILTLPSLCYDCWFFIDQIKPTATLC